MPARKTSLSRLVKRMFIKETTQNYHRAAEVPELTGRLETLILWERKAGRLMRFKRATPLDISLF